MFCKRERSQLLPLKKKKKSWLLNICLVDIILSDPSEDGCLFLVTLGYFLEESQCLDFFRSLDWIDFVTSAHVSGSALLSCCSVIFHQRTAIKFHENPHRDDVLTSITQLISPWSFQGLLSSFFALLFFPRSYIYLCLYVYIYLYILYVPVSILLSLSRYTHLSLLPPYPHIQSYVSIQLYP